MKHEGIIGLFPDNNPESDCAYRINLLRGDEGVSLSDVLPEEMGLVRTQDDITDEMINFFKVTPSPLPPKKLSKSTLQKLKKLKRKKGKVKRRQK